MRLRPAHLNVLQAMSAGHLLKSHRYLDGRKQFQLHPLEGEPQDVPAAIVHHLERHDLIDSNKKFPAATYWLTDKGKRMVAGQEET